LGSLVWLFTLRHRQCLSVDHAMVRRVARDPLSGTGSGGGE
jgi:hypothetical protein